MKRNYSVRALLLAIMCATIIPLNALVIAYGFGLMQVNEERRIDTMQRELDAHCNALNVCENYLANELSGLSNRLLVEIRDVENRRQDSVGIYTVWSEIRRIRQNNDLISFGYVKTDWNSFARITYRGDAVSYEELDDVSDRIYHADLSAYMPQSFSYFNAGDECWLIWNISFRGFCCGFVIRENSLFHALQKQAYAGERDVLVSLNESRTLAQTLPPARGGRIIAVSQSFCEGRFQLRREIPRASITAMTPALNILLLLIAAMTVSFFPLAWTILKRVALKPLRALEGGMRQIADNHIEYRLPEDVPVREFSYMNRVFNDMANEIGSLRIETYEKDIERLQIEATNLRLQVNPHMLLNSFNMIYSLAASHNDACIQEYTLHLVDYFRYALRKSDRLVPLDAEMKFVADYLEIQKIRFPDAFTSSFSMDPSLSSALVPPLMVQNFVENSIKHGMRLGHVMHTDVSAQEDDGNIVITISDNGAGMSAETLALVRGGEPLTDDIGTHIGMWNCRRRMRMFYGEAASFNIESRPGKGTVIRLVLPKICTEDNA